MNGLWKKRIPAFLLTLVMIISLMPMAMAAPGDPDDGDTALEGHTHSFKWEDTKPATCTEAGVRTGTCTVSGCTETTTEPLTPLGHNIGEWTTDTPADCTTPGSQSATCSRCGETQTRPIKALGHQYGNWTTNKEATCSEKGERTRVCETCGTPQTEELPLTEHTYNDSGIKEIAATCTADGSRTYTCSVCGQVGKTETIKALGHTDANGDGKCDRCGATVAHTHTPGSWQNNTTMHWRVCSVCNAKLEESAHSYTLNNNTTCVCGATATHTHQKKGGIQSDATHHWYVCSGCSERLEEAAHSLGSWQKDSAMHWHVCSVCKIKVDESAHSYTLNDKTTCVCGATKAVGITVTFMNGSTAFSTQTNIASGSSPKDPGTPTKSGTGCVYTFAGWSTTNPGTSSVRSGQGIVSATTEVTKNTTYYALYTVRATGKNLSSIDGGSGSSGKVVGGDIAYGINNQFNAITGHAFTSVLFSGASASTYGTLYTNSSKKALAYSYDFSSVSNLYFVPGSRSGYTISYTAADNYNNSVSGTISISSTAATSISYSVSAGKTVSFNRTDFYNLCRNYIGGTLDYVVFSKPGSEYDDYGAVYNSSTSLSRTNLGGAYAYYDKSDAGSKDYYLGNLSFKADSTAKSGTLSLAFTAYNTNRDSFTGTVEIAVSGGVSKGDVSYSAEPGKEVDFNARDFNKAFQAKYGSSKKTLYYVVFDTPSSYNSFRGAIRVGSSSLDRSDLNSAYFYYSTSDAGKNDYALDRLSFKADSNAKNGDTITIPFRAYYDSGSKNYEDCNLVLTVGKGGDTAGDISYDVAPGKSVDFRAKDFNSFFKDNSSGTFSYVEFDQPSSSAFSQGTLYHNYGTSSSKSFSRSTLDDFKFYYSPGSKDYGIGNLSFVATNNFKDTVTLDFTAYGTNGNSVSGTVSVHSTADSDDGDITYSVAPGKSVDFQRTAFNTFFRKQYNSTVSYVVFERPSSTSIFSTGTLYCDYGTSGQTSFSRSDLSGTRFFYNKNDMGRNDYYLDELTFVAGNNFKDPITLNFTAYGEDDDEYVDGTLTIKPDGTAAVLSNYTGSIRYATITGSNVQINANDIARYFKRSYPSYTLQYVTLTGAPATGSLYYNYYNASSYGTTTRTQITSANCSGQNFYLSPTSTTQFALTELTYVPSGTNYCASIPFIAYGTNGISVTGSILISVSRTQVSEVYGVTPRNTAVNFPASSIYSTVLSATGSALSSIQLLSLPPATAGTVYVGTGADRANTQTAYAYASGAGQMSQLRFVPLSSYTGSVEIPYVALDANGSALATGTFSLGVLNNRKTLKDVTSSTWCYKYVMELTDQNVISGYSDGSFKPNSTVTYGAALKLIMLAAGYPEQAPTGKNVFSGYLSKAQADGIVTRSNVNLTAPITRLQVAQLAAGALKLNTSGLSSVKPFTDTSDVYVQALNAAGIVEGYFSNGTSTYQPSKTLNRGQMSAIVWRMNQYRK